MAQLHLNLQRSELLTDLRLGARAELLISPLLDAAELLVDIHVEVNVRWYEL